MGNSAKNRKFASATADVITHGPIHSIRGAGDLLANQSSMMNQGTIVAEGANNPIKIDSDGGSFDYQDNVQINPGSTLSAANGAFSAVNNQSVCNTIVNGTLTTSYARIDG